MREWAAKQSARREEQRKGLWSSNSEGWLPSVLKMRRVVNADNSGDNGYSDGDTKAHNLLSLRRKIGYTRTSDWYRQASA